MAIKKKRATKKVTVDQSGRKKKRVRRAVHTARLSRTLLTEAQSRAIRESYQREAFWSETVLHALASGRGAEYAISLAADLVDERDAREYHRDPFERRYSSRVLKEEREAWEDQTFWAACVHAMVSANRPCLTPRAIQDARSCATSADRIVAERRTQFGTPRQILQRDGLAPKKRKTTTKKG